MDFTTVRENLEKRGFAVSVFETAKDAAEYLDGAIDGKTVAFGGSMTLRQMGLAEKIASHNDLVWHWQPKEGQTPADALQQARRAEIYLCSVNGLAESGEIINIDGAGNRVSAMLYGHKKVYLVVGSNKLAPDYEAALHRARNIAAPLNAKRLSRKTPCVEGGRCYDCASPERICSGLAVLWEKMGGSDMEVVLIGEELGY